jgi:hypothetical protein
MLTVIGVGILLYLGGAANVVTAETQSPDLVLTDQVFIVDLTLHNNTDNEQHIVSIGLDRDLFERGLQIQEILPRYRRIDDFGSRWLEYTFAIQSPPTILPNETLSLRLRMLASQPGRFEGELTLWYNDHIRSDTIPLAITAVSHPVPWLGH